MISIEYKDGDLLKSDETVIAHGCNAQGVMRSGIAAAVRAKYPNVFIDYANCYITQGHKLHLGQVIESKCDDDRVVLNIITQEFYGRDPNRVYVSYDAIRKGILAINHLGYHRVAFPLIGAGLANGDWNTIADIIEFNAHFIPVVYRL